MLVIINSLKNKDHNYLTLKSSINVRNPNPLLLIKPEVILLTLTGIDFIFLQML